MSASVTFQTSPVSLDRADAPSRVFQLDTEQILPRPLDEVFPFFADARNLEAITPSWLRFEVVTSEPIEMREGALIAYKLKVHGIPLRWRSRIAEWDPPHCFVDEQVRGPYRYWWHRHTFESVPDGTRVCDHVRYAVPFGRLANALIVRRDLRRIFSHRQRVIAERFR